MKIELKSGKTFSVLWCGKSSIDDQLRFCANGLNLNSAFNAFSNPTETEEIKCYVNDNGAGEFIPYNGFTMLKGLNENNNGIVVALAKEE